MSNLYSAHLNKFKFVALSTLFPQLTGILALPIITNIYSVEEYGEFTAFIAILITLVNISSFRLVNALYVCRKYEEVYIRNTVQIILWCNFWFLSLIVLVLYFLGIVSSLMLLLPLTFMISSMMSNAYVSISSNKKYQLLSKLKIFEAIVLNLIKIFANSLGSFGLVCAILISSFSSLLISGKSSQTLKLKSKMKSIFLFKKYLNFIKFQFPSQCISLIIQFFPVFYFMYFESKEALGFLALAYTITNIPVNSFGQAISQYVISETGKSTELDKLYLLLKKIMLILFLLAIPFFLHINEISLWVLTTFFDEKWLESHHYIVILAFLGFLKIITMSVINICNIINFQQFQLYLNSSLLIVSVCIAIYSTSANQFINFFVVSNILILIMGISYLMIFLKRVKDEKNIVCW